MAARDVVHAAVGDDDNRAGIGGVHGCARRICAPVAVALVHPAEHDGRGNIAGNVEVVEHERDLGTRVLDCVFAQVSPYLAGRDGTHQAIGACLGDVHDARGRRVLGAVALGVRALAVRVARVVFVAVFVVHHVVGEIHALVLIEGNVLAVDLDAAVGEGDGDLI